MTDLKDYCRRVADDAPPLSAEQRDRLALLLAGKRIPTSRQIRHEALGGVWSPDFPHGAPTVQRPYAPPVPQPYVGDGALAEMLGRR